MPSAAAPVAAEGLPIDLSPYFLTRQDMAKLSMSELHDVATILRAASDLIASSRHAGLLEDISGTLSSLAGDVRDEAEARSPGNQSEADWRGWLMISHAAFVSESLTEIAVRAAQAATVERYACVTR